MTVCIILAALGAVALCLYLCEKLRIYSVRAVVLKSVVSVLFVALGVCAWYASGMQLLGVFVVPGLVLGLLGDVWLDLKYAFPEKDAAFTYAGFASFGAGHVLYITGMLLQFYPGGKPLAVIVPFALALLLSLGNTLLGKQMKLDYGKMKPVVFLYGALLFSTVLVSGSLALLHSWQISALNLLFIGGVLFALSDLVLSGTYFGVGRERPVDLILNYLTYYPAQYVIAFSLLFIV